MSDHTIDPHTLRQFIGTSQRFALVEGTKGEEAGFFFDKIKEYCDRIATMPATYQNQGPDALVYLHYFIHGANFYITEKDCEPEQLQAFGLADLYGDGGELGYISIEELLDIGAELDLYWEPTPLSTVRATRALKVS